MISADEARKLSSINRFKNFIKDEVEGNINTAIENGKFECKVVIPDEIPIELITDVISNLSDAGYMVQDFTTFEGEKYIKIFWGED